MNSKETTYRGIVRRVMGPVTGLFALGFGGGAVFSGLDQQYLLSASELIAALGAGYEAYYNIRHGELDRRGYIVVAIGSLATLLNSPVTEGLNYHRLVGNIGIGPSIIGIVLHRKSSRR